ncbi:MAG: zf-HC2 domain-containing protein [Acidobacteriota bacterium]
MIHPRVELLSAFLEGDLDTASRDQVASHLAECSDCGRRLQSLRDLVETLESLPNR